MSPKLYIPTQLSSNDFCCYYLFIYFSDKIKQIKTKFRNTAFECTTDNSVTGLSFKYLHTRTTAVLYYYRTGRAYKAYYHFKANHMYTRSH